MIITLDLSLKRGDNRIIDGLNLHVAKGEFVFICGQARSGKTSLLRILALRDLPAAGRVIVDGRDMSEIPRREYPAYRRSLGVVFADDSLLEHRTVAENIAISLELTGWDPGEASAEASAYLRRVGMRLAGGLYPAHISQNEQRLTKLCRALARRPKIVLADEPFEGLDSESVEKALELFAEANLRGSTIAITTHNVELAGGLNRRMIMLDKTSLGRMSKVAAD